MTGLNSNLDQIIEQFKLIKGRMQQTDFSDALVAGVNAAKAQMQNRIFNQGLDTKGRSLGKYRGRKKRVSKSKFKGRKTDFLLGNKGTNLELSEYEQKRLAEGRQIRYKDLEFEGALRRGIVVIKESQTSVVCAIPNDTLFAIAGYQEEDLKTIIFAPSEAERETLRTNTNAILKQMYDRLINP